MPSLVIEIICDNLKDAELLRSGSIGAVEEIIDDHIESGHINDETTVDWEIEE
jgi:hypothetical protein